MLKRRAFITATVAALCYPQLLRGKDKKLAPRRGLTLGTSTYGMASLKTEKAVELISTVGFDSLELSAWSGRDEDTAVFSKARRKALRKQLDSSGLKLSSIGESLQIDDDSKKRQHRLERLKLAAQFSNDLAPHEPAFLQTILGGHGLEWDKIKPTYAEELADWIKVADKLKLTIAIKPHRGNAMSRPSQAVELIKMLDTPARLKICYDYSHYDLRDMTLEGTIRTALPYTGHVAVKDVVKDGDSTRFVLPGEGGRIDYPDLLRLFYDGNYRGDINCEVSSQVWRKKGYDPVVAAKTYYRNMARAFEKSGVPRRGRGDG